MGFWLTHLHGIHRLGLTDHAQVVLLRALHLLLALIPHGSRQPLPRRVPGQGGHCGATHRLVFFPVFALAVGVAVVRLRALRALGQVVAVLAAVEAPEDRDPEGLLAGLVFLVVVVVMRRE